MSELNFQAALRMQDRYLLQLAIDLTIEFLNLTGRPITPDELRAKLLKPGL